MSNKSSRSKGKPPSFTTYTYALLDSEAWHWLSVYSRSLYMVLKRRYNGYNNGNIALSVREAADQLGCDVKTVKKAFDQLQDLQFITATKLGSFSQKVNADGSSNSRSTRWLLQEYPQNYKLNSEGSLIESEALSSEKGYMRWSAGETEKQKKQAKIIKRSNSAKASDKRNLRRDVIPPVVGRDTTVKDVAVGRNPTSGGSISHQKDSSSSLAVGRSPTVYNIPHIPTVPPSGSLKEQAQVDTGSEPTFKPISKHLDAIINGRSSTHDDDDDASSEYLKASRGY